MKYQGPGSFETTEICCSQSWKLASQIKVLAGPGEGPLLGYRLLAVSSHGFQGLGKGGKGEVMVKGYKISIIQENSVL